MKKSFELVNLPQELINPLQTQFSQDTEIRRNSYNGGYLGEIFKVLNVPKEIRFI